MSKKALVICGLEKDLGEYFSYAYLSKIFKFLEGEQAEKYDKIFILYEPIMKEEGRKYRISFLQDHCESNSNVTWRIEDSAVPTCIMNKYNITPVCIAYDMSYALWKILKETKKDKITFEEGMNYFVTNSTDDLPITDGGKIKRLYVDYDEKEYFPVFISEQMVQMLNLLNKDEYVVDIIGGGRLKNVELTQKIFTAEKIQSSIIDDLCYDIRIVNSNRHENIFIKKPSRFFRKEYLDCNKEIAFSAMKSTL